MKVKLGKANNVTADAAFKSKSRRELLNIAAQASVPAPGWCRSLCIAVVH